MKQTDLRNKSYEYFLVNNKSKEITKKYFLILFLKIEFVMVFFIKFLNIISCEWSQKSLSFYKKKLQSLS